MKMSFRRHLDKEQKALWSTLLDCQDRCFQTDLEKICRMIGSEMSDCRFTMKDLQELKISLDKALGELKERNYSLSRVYLDRTLGIVKKCKEGKAVNTRMGLFGLFKGKAKKREEFSQSEILDKEEKLTEQKLADLEEKIAALFDNHTKLSAQLEEKARQCAALEKKGNQHQHIRQQAMALIPRIKTIEKQISMYARMLESSSRYQAMLGMGKATLELKKLMPDISRTEALMDLIASDTQEISDDMENLSSGIDTFEKNIDKATDIQAFSSDEFDERVSEIRDMKKQEEESDEVISENFENIASEVNDNGSSIDQVRMVQEEGLT